MAGQRAFQLFGDQSDDFHGFLAESCRRGDRGVLAEAFFNQAGYALRQEINQLPRLERCLLPSFQTLQQLNERYHAQPFKHSGVEAALLCISQVTHYIDHSEKYPHDATDHEHTYLLGLCSGLFAAAAIASTPSLSTLVPVAVQVVLMAFRTGRHVAALAEKLYPTQSQSECWALFLPGAEERDIRSMLEQFHAERGTPQASRVYVSAVARSSITISGPPATLRAVAETGRLPVDSRFISVYGPYHAPHLHGSADIRAILRLDDAQVTDALLHTKPRSSVMSCTKGTWFVETDTKSLLVAVVRQILAETLMFNHIVDNCINLARGWGGKKVLIQPFGPTLNAELLENALKKQTSSDVVLRTPPRISPDSISSTIGNHGSRGRQKLAIVGMAGRFPDAESHEKLWELLCKGLDVHRTVPADRFPVATHVDVTGKSINTSHTPYGCWIEKPGYFDPRFFNMSPREAFQTDPMQRMALTTAYEALEMSGYVPNRTPSTKLDRIGTFYGQTSDDWREINAAQEVDTYFITGGVRAFGPGRINYHFGFSGPSLNIDTACSSSAAAMNVACSALWAKDCDTAIVGGLSCMTNSDIFSGLSRGQFLSKNGPCATFDNDADGYCRGDGCASVVVKRLEDAEADNDRILAVILGTGTNHSADAISITHPHGPTQSILSREILDQAGVDPIDVDYVEMHGTGTQAGDGTEMVSVTDVFAPRERKRPASKPLFLGAVKANVGHGEAASGVTALVKVLLMLQKNSIPPHVGIKKEMNKTFPKDLAERGVNIAFHTTPFKRRDGKPRRVFINNFSAAGGNTGLLVEDGPLRQVPAEDPRSTHVLTVTAKSKAAMIRNAERMVLWMSEHPDTPLAHIAYSTTARKIQHYWRMSITANDVPGAQHAITERLKLEFTPVATEQPQVAFVFTGQGSQYANMGKEFYTYYSIFRQAINEFDQLAQAQGFPSFLPLIDGRAQEMSKVSPLIVQLGLCCLEMALARLWASWGIVPSVVMGHSLGEYPALHVAGVLSASDTIFLVGTRAQLLLEKCTPGSHGMLAVQSPVDSVKSALAGQDFQVNAACVNGRRETVLSGTSSQIAAVAAFLAESLNLQCTQLKVPFAFHSDQVDPILDDFETRAAAVRFNQPKIQIISPLLGKAISNEVIDTAYLRKHARDTVNFLGGLIGAETTSIVNSKTVWLEIGPHPVCTNLVKSAFGASTVNAPSLRRGEPPFKTLSETLCVLHSAGINLDWSEVHHDFLDSVRLLDMPAYSFDEKNYWIQYEGDWCLTKNRLPQITATAVESCQPKLSTTSVQKLVREEVNGDVAIVETESNLSRDDLRACVSGHLVNGAPLCPSSLYADMAMTACDYAYKLIRPDAKDVGINVAGVDVPKTLIFDDKVESHVLKMKVTANVAAGYADLVFSTGSDAKRTEHATCKVLFGDTTEWAAEFGRIAYLVKDRINALMVAEKEGIASKIGRGLAYKLFSALVDYDARYRGMEEVVLDSRTCEATAKIVFQTTEKDGNYFFSPYWIDSLCHISGFIINGSDAVDSREQVFISHGWKSMRFAEIPHASKQYRSYIRMQEIKGTKMMAGDAYVFDGDKLIGICGEIRFQAIPRKVLNMMLPPRGIASAAPVASTAPQRSAAATKASKTSTRAAAKNTKMITPANINKVNAKLVSVVSQVMDILAQEVGVTHDELADNISFAALGVDSLMSLTVAGRIREDLDISIDSHVFVEHATISAFKAYLQRFESPESDSGTSDDGFDPSTEESNNEFDSAATTPEESDVMSEKSMGDTSGLKAIIRATISQEMAVDVDEIIAAPDLAALGMDSLMSLSILGALREKTEMTIDPDLFLNNSSLIAVERALGVVDEPKQATAKSNVAFTAPAITVTSPSPVLVRAKPTSTGLPPSMVLSTISKPPRPDSVPDNYPHRLAASVLLQGSPRNATKNLFMIPDGSGCATSYTEISDISRDWAVWGLFSPFMKTPHEFVCGVYGMATKFITEMKRRQPQGPYSLAGWSAGGVIAYEIVHQLTTAGETVDDLILIDAPCPTTIEALPRSLHAWFAEIGLLGEDDGKSKGSSAPPPELPEWLLPHFAASVTALSNYTPEPIAKDKCPKVMVIWCEDGVCRYESDPRPDPYPVGHALFLLDNRTDFGPNRWDDFLQKDRIRTRHMPGNHFSMMHGQLAKELGSIMQQALLA